MKVLCCGDRDWDNLDVIYNILKEFPEGTTIIEGEARGADKQSAYVAEVLLAHKNFKVERYPADWETYGKAAGPIRNKQMLDEGKPNMVIAFHNDIENSKGTKHMVDIARRKGVHIHIISEKGWVE